ncbi:TatD family hydrolase [Alteromonadaceae bacterium BrNp21-10]|nr:TatD family hydrolase [Alteromonadaceae bacterium BrNp21-10]
MPWFDIGINLTSSRFNADLDGVMQRAVAANVNSLLVTGTSVDESQKAVALTETYPDNLYCTAGVHPHYAGDVTANYMERLIALAQLPCVKAIGECGLDFNRNFSSKQDQLTVFEAQLQLACETQLPVFLHERDAFDEQIALLKLYRQDLVGGVAHCFTGNQAQLEGYLALDLYIGITGWLCDDKRGKDLQQAIQILPNNRLLLETDAPYLAPKTLVGKIKCNEPCYLPEIARYYAELTQQPLTAVEQASFNNARSLFNVVTAIG